MSPGREAKNESLLTLQTGTRNTLRPLNVNPSDICHRRHMHFPHIHRIAASLPARLASVLLPTAPGCAMTSGTKRVVEIGSLEPEATTTKGIHVFAGPAHGCLKCTSNHRHARKFCDMARLKPLVK